MKYSPYQITILHKGMTLVRIYYAYSLALAEAFAQRQAHLKGWLVQSVDAVEDR